MKNTIEIVVSLSVILLFFVIPYQKTDSIDKEIFILLFPTAWKESIYGPEKTPYLDTFHTVSTIYLLSRYFLMISISHVKINYKRVEV